MEQNAFVPRGISMSACLLCAVVLMSPTPSGALSELDQKSTADSIDVDRPAHDRSTRNVFSELLNAGRNVSADFAHPYALPVTLSTHDWPTCNENVLTKYGPCGFSVGQHLPLFHMDTTLNRCWYHSRNWKLNWDKAKAACAKLGPGRRLARVDNYMYSARLSRKMHRAETWIGIREHRNEHDWIFVDNSIFKYPFHGSADNYCSGGRCQDCVMIKDNKDGKWDDNFCHSRLPFFCDQTYWGDERIPHFHDSRNVNLGGPMTFKCTIKSLSNSYLRIKLLSKTSGEYASWEGDYHDYDTPVNTFKYTTSSVGATKSSCTYSYDTTPRCIVTCSYTITVTAYEALRRVQLQCCSVKKCSTKEKRYNVGTGGFMPEIITQFPDTPLIDGRKYTLTCKANLGRDKSTSGTIGVKPSGPRPSDPTYRGDAMKYWEISYAYKDKEIVKEKGNRPDGFKVTKIDTGYSILRSGFYVDITAELGPTLGRFYKSQVFCRSDTELKKQDPGVKGTVNICYKRIDVTFLPREPQVFVEWKGDEGLVYAGDTLKVKCTAFIGSITDPPKMHWTLHVRNGTDKEYTVNYLDPKIPSDDEVGFSQVPGVRKCAENEKSYAADGICYHFNSKEARSWEKSRDYCHKRHLYELAMIDTKEQFRFLEANTGQEGYYIGLNDIKSEANYVWADDTPANIKDWGEWFDPTINDYQWRDDPSKLNCGIVHRRGLETFSCASRMPCICQSAKKYFASPANFDPEMGIKLISTMHLSPKLAHDGAHVTCSSYDRASAKWNAVLDEQVIGVKANTSATPIIFMYGQLPPEVTFKETLENHRLSIEVNCSAYVGPDGLATVTLVHAHGKTRRWIVGGSSGIQAQKPSSSVHFSVPVDDRSYDVGRHIIIMMRIKLTASFDRTTITCYSYDITDRNVFITSYYEKKDLWGSHLIDFTNLSTISKAEVENALYINIGDEDDDEPLKVASSNMMYYSILLVLLGLFVGLLFSEKDKIMKRLRRGGEEDKLEPANVMDSKPSGTYAFDNQLEENQPVDLNDDLRDQGGDKTLRSSYIA